jgi:hypothetical protein
LTRIEARLSAGGREQAMRDNQRCAERVEKIATANRRQVARLTVGASFASVPVLTARPTYLGGEPGERGGGAVETGDRDVFVPRRGNDVFAADNGELGMTGSQTQNAPAAYCPDDKWARVSASRNTAHKSVVITRCTAHQALDAAPTSAACLVTMHSIALRREHQSPRWDARRSASAIANTNDDSDTISAYRWNKEARA